MSFSRQFQGHALHHHAERIEADQQQFIQTVALCRAQLRRQFERPQATTIGPSLAEPFLAHPVQLREVPGQTGESGAYRFGQSRLGRQVEVSLDVAHLANIGIQRNAQRQPFLRRITAQRTATERGLAGRPAEQRQGAVGKGEAGLAVHFNPWLDSPRTTRTLR